MTDIAEILEVVWLNIQFILAFVFEIGWRALGLGLFLCLLLFAFLSRDRKEGDGEDKGGGDSPWKPPS
jgi:hypothetical protein